MGRARTAESLGLCLAAVLMTGLGAMDAPPAVLQVDPVVEHALAAQPEGWERLAVVQIEDADRIFGQQAVWSRTYWRAEETNRAAHSRVGVPRRIVIDDVRVEDDRMLALLPFPAQYDLDGWERSAAVVLEGGELFNVVAMAAVLERIADVSLAATVVSVDVVLAEGGGQRVNVISVDDHRSTAPFLLPGRGVLTDVRSTVQRLLRGDTAGLTELERAKDLELLGGVIMSVLEPTRSERG